MEAQYLVNLESCTAMNHCMNKVEQYFILLRNATFFQISIFLRGRWELQICICTNVENHKAYKVSLKKLKQQRKLKNKYRVTIPWLLGRATRPYFDKHYSRLQPSAYSVPAEIRFKSHVVQCNFILTFRVTPFNSCAFDLIGKNASIN